MISSFSCTKCFVTFDGSCYFSFNRYDSYFCYDFFHVNSIFKVFVLNRIVNSDSESDILNSFFLFYNESLYLPWYLDINEI